MRPRGSEITGWERYEVLKHPWCQAGDLVFGGAGQMFGPKDGELYRAYGYRSEEDIRESPPSVRPPPPPRKLSDDAAGWWNLRWDGGILGF